MVAVSRGGPADKAGLMTGDVIVKIGDHAIEEPNDLMSAILQLEPGTRVQIDVLRRAKPRTFEVELGTRPPLRRAPSERR